MKLDDVQSKQLLPRFADDVEWIQQAFDVIVKHANERAKSIDAPLSMEAIQALTDEELQAQYEQYGIAIYYPDLSRETREKMLYEMCVIYRYLGTPKAIETLCNYIFDGVELNVKVVDNQAFDENGLLVNPSMLDTFDIEIDPQIPVLDTNAHARLLENIIHFSRNSQGLNGINYDFPENFDLSVALGVSGANPVCTVDYINDAICEPVPIPPDGSPNGYIVVDSSGTIQHSIPLSDMFIHQIQHSADIVNFYFTSNGAAETENSELESGVDVTLYNADGTVADDALYDGSGTLTYTQANGNMFEAADGGDLISLQSGALVMNPNADYTALSVQVEKVEDFIEVQYWANDLAINYQNSVTNSFSGTMSSSSIKNLYTDTSYTTTIPYVPSKRYQVGYYDNGEWVNQPSSLADMPADVSYLYPVTVGFIPVDDGTGKLSIWFVTNYYGTVSNTFTSFRMRIYDKEDYIDLIYLAYTGNYPRQSSVTSGFSGTIDNTCTVQLFLDFAKTKLVPFDSNVRYEIGYYDATGVWYPDQYLSLSDLPSDTRPPSSIDANDGLPVNISGYLRVWEVTNATEQRAISITWNSWQIRAYSIKFNTTNLPRESAYFTSSGASGTSNTTIQPSTNASVWYTLYDEYGNAIPYDDTKSYSFIRCFQYNGGGTPFCGEIRFRSYNGYLQMGEVGDRFTSNAFRIEYSVT